MLKKRYTHLTLLTLPLLIMGAGAPARAADNDFNAVFSEEQSLSDNELDEMRGGFLASNGMVIDFIFSTNTLVDGQLVNQVVLNSADPSLTNADSLRNIIQIGEGNEAFSGGTINANTLPNILTIVQNNLDDVTIQQINLLDLSVTNFDNYIQNSVAPEIDFQNTLRLSH